MSNSYKFGSVAYLPPPNIGHPKSFLANIRNFPPKHPLFIYSDYDYSADYKGAIKLAASPEIARCDTNKMATNNLVFFMGIRIAAMQGLTHVMILEPDCRVNKAGFDDDLWREFLDKNPNGIAGGSLAIFNPCSYNRQAAQRLEKLISETREQRIMPFTLAGFKNVAEKHDTYVFPNGAFAIYRMPWLKKVYPQIVDPQENCIDLAQKAITWDYDIGIKLWNEFKEEAYDKVVPLLKMYSGYGDVMSTQEERMQWLSEGKIIGVHQIKGDWIGPMTNRLKPEPSTAMKLENLIQFMPVKPEANSESNRVFNGKASVFWVTHGKDFEWFEYSARSYKKFAKGWHQAKCIVPEEDGDKFRNTCAINGIELILGKQWADKPFNWHQCQKTLADTFFHDSDVIFHMDADSVFAQPCSPQDWMVGNKVLMPYTPYTAFLKRPVDEDEAMTFQGFTGKKIDFNRGQYNWKFAAEFALGEEVSRECMAWQPIAHWREVYQKTRELIQARFPERKFDGFVRSCRDTHPQSYCEFNTLGAVAHKYFESLYHWHNLECGHYPFLGKAIQSHSHGGWDKEHDYGNQVSDKTINTPRKLMESLGLIKRKPGRPPKQ